MTDTALTQALEDIYTSVNSNNENIDALIAQLKKAMGEQKTVEIDAKRLTWGNRESRKRLQAYFRQRGVTVTFAA